MRNWIPFYKPKMSYEEFSKVLYTRCQMFLWKQWPERRPSDDELKARMRRAMQREATEQGFPLEEELMEFLIELAFVWLGSKVTFKSTAGLDELLLLLGYSSCSEFLADHQRGVPIGEALSELLQDSCEFC